MKKYILIFLRIVLGATFIVSAISKLLSIETFEVFILHYKVLSWDLATMLARLIISFEFVLGVLIIFRIYLKQMLILSFTTLLFFSTFLVIMLLSDKNIENCHCFGDQLRLDPLESLIKNIILLIIAVFLYKYKSRTIRYQLFFVSIFSFIMLLFPILYSPPTFIYQAFKYKDSEEKQFRIKSVGRQYFSGEEVDLMSGKKVVAVLSLHCNHCFKAAKTLSLIHNRVENKFPVYYILGGDLSFMNIFWEKSESTYFPFKYVEGREFLDICEGRVPKIYLLEDGIIKKTFSGYKITEDNILSFFEE